MENNQMEKRYGLFTAICMVVGIVIGWGVFFKAQDILNYTGGFDTVFAVICSLFMIFVVLYAHGIAKHKAAAELGEFSFTVCFTSLYTL